MHGSQHFIKWNGGDTGSVVSEAIGDSQLIVVEEGSTSIDDVGHVTITLIPVRRE